MSEFSIAQVLGFAAWMPKKRAYYTKLQPIQSAQQLNFRLFLTIYSLSNALLTLAIVHAGTEYNKKSRSFRNQRLSRR